MAVGRSVGTANYYDGRHDVMAGKLGRGMAWLITTVNLAAVATRRKAYARAVRRTHEQKHGARIRQLCTALSHDIAPEDSDNMDRHHQQSCMPLGESVVHERQKENEHSTWQYIAHKT